MFDKVNESQRFIFNNVPNRPKIAIILGSGLGDLANDIDDKVSIKYEDIPNFPTVSVVGHSGELLFGSIDGVEIVAMAGRFHFYEGYSMKEVTYPIYVFKQMGIEQIIVSNACGGINEDFEPGSLMVIDDFINLMGTNPLVGANDERFGPRFPDMTEPYSKRLMKYAFDTASELDLKLESGVYAGFQGPYYETRAEVRMIKGMGVDVVGMSTVPETIVANQLGLEVLGISCITNMATGIQKKKHSHEEVVKQAKVAGIMFVKIIKGVLKKIGE